MKAGRASHLALLSCETAGPSTALLAKGASSFAQDDNFVEGASENKKVTSSQDDNFVGATGKSQGKYRDSGCARMTLRVRGNDKGGIRRFFASL
jgi:hypothetical protein